MPEAQGPPSQLNTERHISRGPVVVLVAGAALIVSLVLLGAALAGAPAPTPAPSMVAGTDAQPRDVNIIMRDYHFAPTPLYLFPGETVRLTVFNAGMIDHELVLGDAAVQQAWDAADAAATPPAAFATSPPASVDPQVGGLHIALPSGASTTVIYHVPTDGQLELICHLPGHEAAGMVGQVVLVR